MRSSLTCVAGWLTLFLAVVSADSVITIYKKEGDEVVLNPGGVPLSGIITSIMWKDGSNIAIQWDGAETDSYRQFKERGSLNTTTGEMTITGLTRTDSGLYTPEINNVILSPTRLQVISPVPKPTVSESCDDEKTSCTLTCDGNTTGADPVNYRWRSDGKEMASSKEQHITKDNSSGVNEFTCELENPISRESSRPIPNPLTKAPRQEGKLNISTGVTVFICLLVLLLLLVTIHRCKAGMWFFQKSSMPWEADFWRKHERLPSDAAESNGTTAQEKEQKDEETPMT